MIETLRKRFQENMDRHPSVQWQTVEALLQKVEKMLRALSMLEESGGEPDILVMNGHILLCDCAKESPAGRRSLCYDREARLSRKKNTPAGSAVEEAERMGARLMTEAEYRHLQTLGEFDLKTSSWVQTPEEIRRLGGAIFCERRYGTVFTFHNGADSYYGVRGFRCVLTVE